MVVSQSGDPLVKRKRGRPRKYVDAAMDANGLPSSISTPLRTMLSSGASPRERKAGKSKKAQLAALGQSTAPSPLIPLLSSIDERPQKKSIYAFL
jgi:hypothetical protein